MHEQLIEVNGRRVESVRAARGGTRVFFAEHQVVKGSEHGFILHEVHEYLLLGLIGKVFELPLGLQDVIYATLLIRLSQWVIAAPLNIDFLVTLLDLHEGLDALKEEVLRQLSWDLPRLFDIRQLLALQPSHVNVAKERRIVQILSF